MIKDLEYYMNIEYDIVVSKITKEDGGGYFAYYADFKGVMGDGESKLEAIKDAKEAFKEFVEVSLENKDTIYEAQGKIKTERVNVSLKENILHYIDDYCKMNNISRSSFLVEASMSKLNLAH